MNPPLIRVLAAEGRRVRVPDLNDQPVPADGTGTPVIPTVYIRRQIAEGGLIEVDEEGKPVAKPEEPAPADAAPEQPAEAGATAAPAPAPAGKTVRNGAQRSE